MILWLWHQGKWNFLWIYLILGTRFSILWTKIGALKALKKCGLISIFIHLLSYLSFPEYPTETTSQPTPPSRSIPANVRRIYELASQTIKVLKNETVMLVCPNDASISSARPLTSLRHIWRGQNGVIGHKKFLFSSTDPSTKTETKFSCQHDFVDSEGREISLLKNFTLRLQSDQIELPVGERRKSGNGDRGANRVARGR